MDRRRGYLALAFVLFFAFACGSESSASDATDGVDAADVSEADTPEVHYPLDDVLRINHIQSKGTHNSYHVRPPAAVSPQAPWLSTIGGASGARRVSRSRRMCR